MSKLTGKKAAFIREYMLDMNQTKAAIRAGYSEKTAAQAASRLMKDSDVKAAIDEWRAELHRRRTADADEVIEFWTAIMRGETPDHIPLLSGKGKQKISEIPTSVRDRLKASEKLGRYYGMDKGRSTEDEQEDSVRSFLEAVKPSDDEVAEVFGNAEAETEQRF